MKFVYDKTKEVERQIYDLIIIIIININGNDNHKFENYEYYEESRVYVIFRGQMSPL